MAELRHTRAPRRAVVLLGAALMLGGPATGQGPWPPVPGPFPVNPVTGYGMQMPSPTPPAGPEAGETRVRPMFQAPANALRVPYWMQPPVANPPPAGATAVAEVTPGAAAGASAQGPVAPAARAAGPRSPATAGYILPGPSWAGPGYGTPGYAAEGYGAQGYAGQGYAGQGYGAQAPWPGQATAGATAPGPVGIPTTPAMPWPGQPVWGYGSAPGWGGVPQAGWGPVWGVPFTGVGQ